MSEDRVMQLGSASVSVEFYCDVIKLLAHRHPDRAYSIEMHSLLVRQLGEIDRSYRDLPLETPKKAVGFAAAKRGET